MVKIISLLCTFLLMLVNPALAISPINDEVIKEAQDYGKNMKHLQLEDFLRPWVSYEEKAANLNETAEHAYLYTSFLLLATDAREKSLNGQIVSHLDSERILTDYTELLSFSVVLFGEKQDFAQKANIILKQGDKVIKAYQINIPSSAEKISTDGGQPLFAAQCYCYFSEKKIELNSPITLSIVTGDKRKHLFYFDIAKIK
ncbi:MAG: hypothetical protein H7X79_06765 [Sporomusaceae bacterium]|nr:hypothetical protein [Sporomusaceae bacterium]